jgi:hypothetical protein
VAGAWKASAARLTEGKSPQIMQQELEQMQQLSSVLLEVSQELEAGKYATAEQLDDAIRGKRLRAMTRVEPATAPQQR